MSAKKTNLLELSRETKVFSRFLLALSIVFIIGSSKSPYRFDDWLICFAILES